jgi:phosphatidylserine/phosphatidylglycerophosphate/cardiolipin synthase-like enzyme
MMEPLQELSAGDLSHLRDLIQGGRLGPPFPAAALGALHNREAVARSFQSLSADGMSPKHIALLLGLLAQERSRLSSARDFVELVWTGPEGAGVANRDTAVVVRELFSEARESVLLAGYAVYQGRAVFKALADRMDTIPDLKVKMFLDVHRTPSDTSPDSEVVARFSATFTHKEWPGQRIPEIFYDPRSLVLESPKKASLHAKCIVVDRAVAFVSSANFTEAAQERNIELGALIRSSSFAAQVVEHFEKLASARLLLRAPGSG